MINKELREQIKHQRNEYAKRWRAANKDKVKAAQERYWAKKVAANGGGGDEQKPCL